MDTTQPMPPPGPLSGTRVLDISTLFPGGFLAAMLGDLGADVAKVEPPTGDPLRHTGVRRDGYPTVWAVAGRGKRSISIDLKSDTGRDVLRRLAAAADVIVANQPERVLDRWGCTFDEVRRTNEGVIFVWITGFGPEGPDAHRAASGTLAEAFAGLTHLIGDPEGPPELLSVPLGDTMAALVGLNGALAALFTRATAHGAGQLVDVSMYEAVLPLLATTLGAWAPGSPAPTRSGGRIRGGAPRGTFRTGDGRWIALSGATDDQTARLLGAISADTPENLERFGSSDARSRHEADLDALIRSWIGDRGAVDALQALDGARVPATMVNGLDDLVTHPHVRHRESIATIDQPGLGPVSFPAPTPRLTDTPARINKPAPALGAHADEICADWLGASPDQVESWRRAGAL